MLDDKQKADIEFSVVVALGSNLLDPLVQILAAIDRLRSQFNTSFRASSVYRTAPISMQDASEDFANAVVIFNTNRAAPELLATLQAMEADAGRPGQHGRNEARVLDLDIIAYGDFMLDSDELQIPHPRAHQRQFVMVPLAEICPDFRFVGRDQSLQELMAQASATRVEKWL
jgi:2-amino-4-hydroxy-6-hydroxymethyldihydropteridine diphosphokinase